MGTDMGIQSEKERQRLCCTALKCHKTPRTQCTPGPGVTPDCTLAFNALQHSDLYKNTGADEPGLEVPYIPPYPLTFFSFPLARDFNIRLVKGDVGIYWAPISGAKSA
jgi:hypothetical protein